MRHGAARCDMVRHGTTRYGTMRHGAARCDMVRHDATWCGTVRHGTARCDMVRHDATWCGTVRHGAVRCGTARCGAVRHDAVRHGAARCCRIRYDAAPHVYSSIRGILRCPYKIYHIFERERDKEYGLFRFYFLFTEESADHADQDRCSCDDCGSDYAGNCGSGGRFTAGECVIR